MKSSARNALCPAQTTSGAATATPSAASAASRGRQAPRASSSSGARATRTRLTGRIRTSSASAETDGDGSSRRARLDEPRGEQRGERERGGVQRVAREPVEEEHVARVGENERRQHDPRRDADAAPDAPPAEHRERVESGHRDLGGHGPEREERLRDDPRHGSAHQERLREDDLVRTQLERRAQVRPEIPPRRERERDGDERVLDERDAGEHDRWRPGAPRTPRAGARRV